MTGRTYTISVSGLTVASASPLTLIALMVPSNGQIIAEIIRMKISQTGSTSSAQAGVQWGWKATAFQTVTSATPQPIEGSAPASLITGATTIAAGKCGVNASAEGAGTFTKIDNDSFNVLNGWLWVPTPNETILLSAYNTSLAAAQAFALQFSTNESGISAWAVELTYRELG